ncbi:sensor histidine kinase [Nesterenkonia flava]|uniref:histidine kinase n=1 Tax=Nesterenkonia flava TaxID=469799 RepID=A0ABU1FSY5_9MICC|nr:histidine kinase [Nesterenkonia flava]MDR5711778.1 histidine kinase [Nesterenkonia flava]
MTTTDPHPAPDHPSPSTDWEEMGLLRRRGVRGWLRRHPRVMDAIVVVIYLLLSCGNLGLLFNDMGEHWWWVLSLNGLIAAALALRHWRPLLITGVIVVLEAAALWIYPWHNAQLIGLCFALYCVGLARGLKWGLPAAVIGTALSYVPGLRAQAWVAQHGEPLMTELTEVTTMTFMATIAPIMTVLAGVSAGIGAAVRRGRLHEREMLEWARRSRELAQVGERNRIAREMHDVVAHSLSVMISLADGARVVVKKDPQRALEVLDELAGTGRSALADMRRVIGVLKKGEDVGQARRPVQESLEELYEGFRQAGLPLTVTHTGPPLPEDTAFGLTVHRIIQEALTNVLRYGRQVTEVEVRIEHREGASQSERDRLSLQGLSAADQEALGLNHSPEVAITVTDDGLATPDGSRRESVGSGLGIQGMQERAGFYNGSIYAGPLKHRGWVVRAVLEPPAAAEKKKAGR